jgi:iron(III) transport system substrate-binding protein
MCWSVRIPAYLQSGDNQWFAFSQRARIIFYDRTDVENPPQTYQDLASPEYAGMVCIRSSTNVYTQNITAALIAHLGQDAVQDWATAVVGKLRPRSAGRRHRPAARHRLG